MARARTKSPIIYVVMDIVKCEQIGTITNEQLRRYFNRPRAFTADLIKQFNDEKQKAGEPERILTKLRRSQKNPTWSSHPKKKPRYMIAKAGRPRGIRNNPTDRSMRKAVRLYSDFTGHNPTFTDEWDVDVPNTALQVGHVTGILYKTKMDGKMQEYMHEFTGASRPILAASADGRQLLLLGGDYKFTERGIVDGTYSIT